MIVPSESKSIGTWFNTFNIIQTNSINLLTYYFNKFIEIYFDLVSWCPVDELSNMILKKLAFDKVTFKWQNSEFRKNLAVEFA